MKNIQIRPQAASLRSRLMSICFREGLKADPNALDQLCASTRSDMRQMLNILSTWKLSNDTMTYDQGKQL
ncbi:Replication factor C subunit 1 [Zancudomyces culisetae]|uniref:Replication factor C subunit 1 n=1 Tax=Zancudomyces culisetae TaxID=1213189 RepID=A0A1R1PV34_ZANCU|nr:Replication factor C subunit 1 [Zancudomyces culisetae]|eukprot:OMH84793.1 Replication factor C subunit 1 [Zancudomyces culisetae]